MITPHVELHLQQGMASITLWRQRELCWRRDACSVMPEMRNAMGVTEKE